MEVGRAVGFAVGLLVGLVDGIADRLEVGLTDIVGLDFEVG